MTVDRSTETNDPTDRALDAMARIVRDWDATAYEVAKAEGSSEPGSLPHDGYLGLGSYRPLISDQAIDALRAYLEIHRPSLGTLFDRLIEAVSERFDLDCDQAMRFVSESCTGAGGLPNPEDDPELIEQLREAALHGPNVDWLLEGLEERGA